MGSSNGKSAGGEFFAWMLDATPPERAAGLLGRLPAPPRLVVPSGMETPLRQGKPLVTPRPNGHSARMGSHIPAAPVGIPIRRSGALPGQCLATADPGTVTLGDEHCGLMMVVLSLLRP